MSELVRIVRMTFQESEVENFLRVFNNNKNSIRSFPGCKHLELHKDYHQPHIFSTYSIWENDKSLENYRHSELFKSVWAKTKPLFKEKPIAFSNQCVDKLQ
ncbi:putative quinol monooxygenase [Fulvivirga sp. M361]|uniref:putative quinol monooxygenase n=1 Tax=Fulvivirga sp. M361 TaxID=2594266 RepID=UPI00210723EF|nr:antibiotic biosynthesis monooxygenase family protein [Fulvivirga sp. M361]